MTTGGGRQPEGSKTKYQGTTTKQTQANQQKHSPPEKATQDLSKQEAGNIQADDNPKEDCTRTQEQQVPMGTEPTQASPMQMVIYKTKIC